MPRRPSSDPAPARVDEPLAAALRAIRAAAAALEGGRRADAREALAEAARLVVFLHTEADARGDAADLMRAFRWIAFRLKDAELLGDASLARDAERVFGLLASGLRGRSGPPEDVA
jgi:hypothetical protein